MSKYKYQTQSPNNVLFAVTSRKIAERLNESDDQRHHQRENRDGIRERDRQDHIRADLARRFRIPADRLHGSPADKTNAQTRPDGTHADGNRRGQLSHYF